MGKRVKEGGSMEQEGVLKNLLKVLSYIRVINSITLLDLWVACRLQKASLWPRGASIWFPELPGQCGWGKWMLALPSTARVKVSVIKALNPEIKVCTGIELTSEPAPTHVYKTWPDCTDFLNLKPKSGLMWCYILVISYPKHFKVYVIYRAYMLTLET